MDPHNGVDPLDKGVVIKNAQIPPRSSSCDLSPRGFYRAGLWDLRGTNRVIRNESMAIDRDPSENVKNTYLSVICRLSRLFALNNPGPDFDVLEASEWQEISQNKIK